MSADRLQNVLLHFHWNRAIFIGYSDQHSHASRPVISMSVPSPLHTCPDRQSLFGFGGVAATHLLGA